MSRIHYWELSNYNNGKLVGKWFDLDFKDKEEHQDEIEEWLADLYDTEEDVDYEEVVIGDTEDIDDRFICDGELLDEYFEFEALMRSTLLSEEVILAGMACQIPLDDIEDCYVGEFSSDSDLAAHCAEQSGLFDGVDETLERYFDFESYGADLAMGFSEHNGHYFINK